MPETPFKTPFGRPVQPALDLWGDTQDQAEADRVWAERMKREGAERAERLKAEFAREAARQERLKAEREAAEKARQERVRQEQAKARQEQEQARAKAEQEYQEQQSRYSRARDKAKAEYEGFDPYQVLGVPRTASRGEIRAAWIALVKVHHPDHGGDPVKFRDVQRAYEMLNGKKGR